MAVEPPPLHNGVMCGRFAQSKETDELIQEFVAAGGDFRDWRPGWNIAPTDTIAVVLESAKGGANPVRRLEPARWSLVPSWSPTLKTKFPTFNARSEGITEKSSWSGPVRHHRCIVPVDGYFEWVTDPVTGKKTPFYISLSGGASLELAGLYSWWRDHSVPDDDPGAWTLTATILTADSVHTLDHIHDRNPVPLPREWRDSWLDPGTVGDQGFVDAAVAAAVGVAETLQFWEVGPVKGDGPELVEPIS